MRLESPTSDNYLQNRGATDELLFTSRWRGSASGWVYFLLSIGGAERRLAGLARTDRAVLHGGNRPAAHLEWQNRPEHSLEDPAERRRPRPDRLRQPRPFLPHCLARSDFHHHRGLAQRC